MNWYLEQCLGIILVIVVAVAVGWEISHLFEWRIFLGDDKFHYIREHAYHYVTWLFGTDFGWHY